MNSQVYKICELSWGEHDIKKETKETVNPKIGSYENPHNIKFDDLYHDLSKNYQNKIRDHNATLGRPVLNSVRHYTSATGSKNINRHLRQSEPIGFEQKEHLENLKQATQHVLPQNLTLYRGSNIHPKHLSVGTTFTDSGFTSTSKEPDAPRLFSAKTPDINRTIFQIKADKPLKGHDVNGNTEYPFENEVILHPNTKFTVTGHSRTKENDHIVHLHAHREDDKN